MQLVAVGRRPAADVDGGLDNEAVTRPVLRPQIVAHFDDGEANFVSKHHGTLAHVVVNVRMLLAGADHLDIRETDANGVVTHQQLIGAGMGKRKVQRQAANPEILKTGAVKRPKAVLCGRDNPGAIAFKAG